MDNSLVINYLNAIARFSPADQQPFIEVFKKRFELDKGSYYRSEILAFLASAQAEVLSKDLLLSGFYDPDEEVRIWVLKYINDQQLRGYEDRLLEQLNKFLLLPKQTEKKLNNEHLDRRPIVQLSEEELRFYFKYLDKKALPALRKAWQNDQVSDVVKMNYLQAAAQHDQDFLRAPEYRNAFTYFYNKKDKEFQIFALKSLFFLAENKTDVMAKALGSDKLRVRVSAMQIINELGLKTFDSFLLDRLRQGALSGTEWRLAVGQLGKIALPVLKDFLRTNFDEDLHINCMYAIITNYHKLDLNQLEEEVQALKKSSNEDLLQKVHLFQYLIFYQKGRLQEAASLVLQHPFIPDILLSYTNFMSIYESPNLFPQQKMALLEAGLAASEAILTKKEANVIFKENLASKYGNAAWYYLFAKAYPKAEEAAQRGLALAPSQTWIITNYALALLLQSKWEKAKKVYLEYKSKRDDSGRLFKDIFLKDFKDLEKAGITHPDIVKIRALLKQ